MPRLIHRSRGFTARALHFQEMNPWLIGAGVIE